MKRTCGFICPSDDSITNDSELKKLIVDELKRLITHKHITRFLTEELIGLQDLIIERIESDEKDIHIYGKLTRKVHQCPDCEAETDKIHDYREQVIKDIPIYGKRAFTGY